MSGVIQQQRCKKCRATWSMDNGVFTPPMRAPEHLTEWVCADRGAHDVIDALSPNIPAPTTEASGSREMESTVTSLGNVQISVGADNEEPAMRVSSQLQVAATAAVQDVVADGRTQAIVYAATGDLAGARGHVVDVWSGLTEHFTLSLEAPLKLLLRLLSNYVSRGLEDDINARDAVELMKSDFQSIHEALDSLRTAKLNTAADEYETAILSLREYRDQTMSYQSMLVDGGGGGEGSSAGGGPEAERAAQQAKLAFEEAQQRFRHCETLADEAFRTVKTVEEKLQAVKLAFAAVAMSHLENPKLALSLVGAKLKKLHADPHVLTALKSQYESKNNVSKAFSRAGGHEKRDAVLEGVAALHYELMRLHTQAANTTTTAAAAADGGHDALPAVYSQLGLEQMGRIDWLGRRKGDPLPPGVAHLLCSNALASDLPLVQQLGGKTFCDLSNSSLTDASVIALAAALTYNMGLKGLSLDGNAITDTGAQALATALHTNTTLTLLTLHNNSITDTGAQALAAALHTNTTFAELGLDGNAITAAGAQALAAALHTNTTLTQLFLNNTAIGDAGAQALATALQTNTTLTMLTLNNTGITDAGVEALAAALQTNRTLTLLTLAGNTYSASAKLSLRTAAARISGLTLVQP